MPVGAGHGVRGLAPEGYETVAAVLAAAAHRNPEHEAYVEPAVDGSSRRSLSFSEWDRAADGVAGMLEGRGVRRGDVVCLILPSSIDYAVCYAAAWRLGAVTSGMNPRLGAPELAGITSRTRPAVTVFDPGLEIDAPPGCGVLVSREEARASSQGPGPRRRPEVRGEDAVAVVWTSGTGGRPKGAVFDHRNLAAVARGTDALSAVGDRRLSPLPFAHVGYMTRVWDEMARGITTVVTPSPWRARDALTAIVEEHVTVAQGVPTQWALLLQLDELDRADLSSLRLAATGAARVPVSLVGEMRHRLGVPVVVRYTSTETSLGTGTDPADPDEVVSSTVGRPVHGVELVITDDEGRPVPDGEVGRVRLRSAAGMRGLWADRTEARPWGDAEAPHGTAPFVDAAASAAVTTGDGWVVTGDFGTLDGGNLRLLGREHDLYIRGGYNVYPSEVEAALTAHPAVEAAAVVGTPDTVLGEVGVAFVVTPSGRGVPQPPDPADLLSLVAATLADYKVPDAIVMVDSLPQTPMMKVDKRALAEAAASAAAARTHRPARAAAGVARRARNA